MRHLNKRIEHAKVFGFKYGTLKETVNKFFKKRKDVLFDIDWQGYQQLKQSKMATKIAKRNLLYVISVGKFFIDQSKFVGRSFKWPCLFIIFHSSIKILFHLSVNGFFNISS